MTWPLSVLASGVRTIRPVNELRGLIVDFYGVLTDGIDTAMRAWSDLDDIDYAHFQDAMSEWFGDFGGFEARFNPVHALERGELEVPDFEARARAPPDQT